MNAIASSMARGACPALDAPMLTGDGYLSRVALIEAISPAQVIALFSLSVKHGNGMLDISARGNLQIRGLTLGSAAKLEADVRALDLPLREGLAVEWSPLAGLEDGIDPRPLGLAIMDHARALRGRLAPKLSVVLETNGLLRLDDLLADIRLVATGETGWNVFLGGTLKTGRAIGFVRDENAADCVAALLDHFASLGLRARGRQIEPATLPQDVLRHLEPVKTHVSQPQQNVFGLFAVGQAYNALRVALPFGQINARALAEFARQAEDFSIESIRPAPDHSLVAFGDEKACANLHGVAEQVGLIVQADDPLRQIDACPGSPSCNSARLETHALGRFAASETPGLFDESLRLHLSGCAKGCVHPTPSPLALVGSENGSHLVFCGKTTDTPIKQLAPGHAKAALRALARLIETSRRDGETNHDCLVRLGPGGIVAALGEGP
ncbi:precorrin-3B synthase [Rhizobium oryzicola]|uniref:Precorrin-3B synthase n=1 Tax=Rhizobium oryzicola TaxID=1232668 RepID=A0ABT8T3E0_9HYPH|nr:precorrin-3B synthase [Rhizobium oryzicola]MDO1585206.1 precorrin-3B synthase [Rhizobium oryzicola]